MNIGAKLTLEVIDPKTNKEQKYRCTLIEKDANYLYIDYPINNDTNKTAFLTKGTIFRVNYVDEDQAVYQFNSIIKNYVKIKVPAIAIMYPEKEEIKRIQRRQFVRIETAIDVSIHSNDQSFSPFTTVTTDISGGGLSIIIPEEHPIQKGDHITAYMVLRLYNGMYRYIFAEGEIVFLKELRMGIHTASLKFYSIDSSYQQDIIQFCFEKQREARQKELT